MTVTRLSSNRAFAHSAANSSSMQEELGLKLGLALTLLGLQQRDEGSREAYIHSEGLPRSVILIVSFRSDG